MIIKKKKKKEQRSRFLGFILILCTMGIVFLLPLFKSNNIKKYFLNFISPFKEIINKTATNIYNEGGIDFEAKQLANLANNSDQFLLYTIDTGNSDCMLLRSPEGATMLVDSGEYDDFENISATLRAFNIDSIDYIIATHPDADHIGSMGKIIKSFKPKHFFMPDCENNTIAYDKMIEALDESNIKPILIKEPFSFNLGSAKIDILQPTRYYDSVNNNSIVALATYKNIKILLIGDIEKEAIGDLIKNNKSLIDADILKVGHHGSSSSITTDFIDAVTPEIAVIPCGKDNDYGHPHKKTIEILNKGRVKIFRTDKSGDIALYTNGDTLKPYTQLNN